MERIRSKEEIKQWFFSFAYLYLGCHSLNEFGRKGGVQIAFNGPHDVPNRAVKYANT